MTDTYRVSVCHHHDLVGVRQKTEHLSSTPVLSLGSTLLIGWLYWCHCLDYTLNAHRQTYRHTERRIDRHTDRETDIQTDRQTAASPLPCQHAADRSTVWMSLPGPHTEHTHTQTHTYRQTYRQIDIQTDRYTYKQTHRQTDTHRDTHTDRLSSCESQLAWNAHSRALLDSFWENVHH